MKRLLTGAAITLLTLFGATLAAPAAQAAPWTTPLTPIEELDVDRYLGDWYQLAANPAPFNLDCVLDTTANYQLINDENIRVENNCTTISGDRRGVVGNAKINGPAELSVSFGDQSVYPASDASNYLVAYIADDYSWALVGDPTRLSGFVLSRTPAVDDEGWQEIRSVVEAQGYNACLMLTSPTTEGLKEIQPLCTL